MIKEKIIIQDPSDLAQAYRNFTEVEQKQIVKLKQLLLEMKIYEFLILFEAL